MKRISLTILLITVISVTINYSQADKVRTYLSMVAQGKVMEVKQQLPDLLVEYYDDPGVQLLHAVVIDDAFKAVEIYERIVTKYPTSEFADEAYWRIVQFYAIKGDTAKASGELDKYRKAFPNSQYLIAATDAVRASIGITKVTPRTNVISLSREKVIPKAVNIKPDEEEPAVINKPKEEVKRVEDKPLPSKGTFGLQVGIYSTHEAAKNEIERFKSQRLRADILEKKVNGVLMWAVVIGDYSTKESAEAAKNIVQQQCNCNPLIFSK